MESKYGLLHFVLLPHLAHGHLIPMMDMARLLARRGLAVTVITTPLNASRFRQTIIRCVESGFRIELLQVPFPSVEAGLPEGCESMDSLPSRDMFKNLLLGISMLEHPVEKLFDQLNPRPTCIISDKNIMWADSMAATFGIPRLVFDGTSCFSLLCTHNIIESRVYEGKSELEPFVVPGLPDRIELTRVQLPNAVNITPSDTKGVREEIRAKELSAYGVVVNTFEELEAAYIEEYRKIRGKVWCIGPVSLCNKDYLDMVERGNKASINEEICLKWLESWGRSSVLYVCLGSLSRLTPMQLMELGLGIESAGKPFIWVIRGGNILPEFDNWIAESGFEDRTRGRGLLIRGWAPQVLILSHPSIGGFLTHCGWNSTLEGICDGVPMVTWPMFAEQFYNEKIIIQVLKIGVSLGSEFAVRWGEEDKFRVLMKREKLKEAIEHLMNEGEEAQERRKRAAEIGHKANKAMEEGGSSYLNLTLLIEDIMQQVGVSRV